MTAEDNHRVTDKLLVKKIFFPVAKRTANVFIVQRVDVFSVFYLTRSALAADLVVAKVIDVKVLMEGKSGVCVDSTGIGVIEGSSRLPFDIIPKQV